MLMIAFHLRTPTATGSRYRLSANRGFTFVEILAALLFLAMLVPVITEGLTMANRASVISERSALAGELAVNKVNELTLNNAWASGETKGDFGKDWPDYRWQMTQGQWKSGTMTELTMEVFYPLQGKERSVRLATLVSLTGSSTGGSSF